MSEIEYGTLDQPTFHVFRADGSEVKPGDQLISRGEVEIFKGCVHPRKIYTDVYDRYPSVFDLEIRGPMGYVWNPVTDEGRELRAAYDAAGRPAW